MYQKNLLPLKDCTEHDDYRDLEKVIIALSWTVSFSKDWMS